MFNISSFLEKFKNIGVEELLFKEAIISSINDKVKVSITSKDIVFKNSIVTIKSNPMVKSEIFMKKNLLLAEIKRRSPQVTVLDIR